MGKSLGALRDVVKQELRSNILTNQLKPGQRIIEMEIAKQFGISQVPVREALQGLEEEGLISIEKYKGAVVTEIEVSEMFHIYNLRSQIELSVIELILPNLKNRHFGDLYDIAEQMKVNNEKQNYADLAELDTAFHWKLIEWSNIDIYKRVWNMCYGRIRRFISMIHPSNKEKNIEFYERHVKLIQILEERDVEKAKSEFQTHIMRTFNEGYYKKLDKNV
ncbi:GntR family transcriptional regulator [Salibacterium aidingense]|uniref:GntR family transcriptional regulator n=1 Tax=Salibacterium aidingense TaxID=384933 RepID=UPI003BCF99AD